ncbi:CDGSH iron-sulfur domain-containing protein [Streptomyces sp. CB02923]|uniref:CDGSH iron-sulfur domain-containing protein n=1 Tax=Streptomyces sp. CB02923 TaxID=1718985 RepID=UPI00267CBD2F
MPSAPREQEPVPGSEGTGDTGEAEEIGEAGEAEETEETGRDGAGHREARRVVRDPGGPVLVEGPVEVELDDGTTARSDRPFVALCMCRRSRTFPWCDTSHRGRKRSPAARTATAATAATGTTAATASQRCEPAQRYDPSQQGEPSQRGEQ